MERYQTPLDIYNTSHMCTGQRTLKVFEKENGKTFKGDRRNILSIKFQTMALSHCCGQPRLFVPFSAISLCQLAAECIFNLADSFKDGERSTTTPHILNKKSLSRRFLKDTYLMACAWSWTTDAWPACSMLAECRSCSPLTSWYKHSSSGSFFICFTKPCW